MTSKQFAEISYSKPFNTVIGIITVIGFFSVLYSYPQFQEINRLVLILFGLLAFCAVWIKVVALFIPVWFILWIIEKCKSKEN